MGYTSNEALLPEVSCLMFLDVAMRRQRLENPAYIIHHAEYGCPFGRFCRGWGNHSRFCGQKARKYHHRRHHERAMTHEQNSLYCAVSAGVLSREQALE